MLPPVRGPLRRGLVMLVVRHFRVGSGLEKRCYQGQVAGEGRLVEGGAAILAGVEVEPRSGDSGDRGRSRRAADQRRPLPAQCREDIRVGSRLRRAGVVRIEQPPGQPVEIVEFRNDRARAPQVRQKRPPGYGPGGA